MLADGLVRATDNTTHGNEAFFAQIRPAIPGDGDWDLGYVQFCYLVMVSLFGAHAQMVLCSKVSSQTRVKIVYFAETGCRGKIGDFAVV